MTTRLTWKVLLVIMPLLIFSCGQNSKQRELDIKEKELALKQRELDIKEKELSIKEKPPHIDTSKALSSNAKKVSSNTKSMKMIFVEYSEGDLMHLSFKDIATGVEYDFGSDIDIKKFNGIKILLDDKDAAFGYKGNPQYLNKTFLIEAVRKTVLTSDPITGKAVKAKAWVINDLKSI